MEIFDCAVIRMLDSIHVLRASFYGSTHRPTATRVHVIAYVRVFSVHHNLGMMIYNRHARELATRGRHPIV